MTIIGPDGTVVLGPSKLAILACPRRGKQLLEAPRKEPGIPAVVGTAAHAVLATLGRERGWGDSFEAIPVLAADALSRKWPSGADPEQYQLELAALIDMLRRFAYSWHRPTGGNPLVETWAEFRHRESRLRIVGRLDLLLPPPGAAGSAALVIDFKSGREPLAPTEEEETPLEVVAIAALARARLSLRCPVQVSYVYLRTSAEHVWNLDQSRLLEGWRRIRGVVADIREDRWPARPGEWCVWCREDECELRPSTPDAEDLGLEDSSSTELV